MACNGLKDARVKTAPSATHLRSRGGLCLAFQSLGLEMVKRGLNALEK